MLVSLSGIAQNDLSVYFTKPLPKDGPFYCSCGFYYARIAQLVE